MFIGRPLPVGDGWRIFGSFVALSPHLVDDALALLDEGDDAIQDGEPPVRNDHGLRRL